MKLEQLAPISALPAIPTGDAEPITVGEGCVDLWCFFYERALDGQGIREAYRALLNDEERQRHERFHFAKDRDLFLATRALVRTTLSRYRPTAPADWRFGKGDHGKPYIEGEHRGLHFNLSNTRGLVVCAVSDQHEALGIDAEDLQRDSETIAIADRFFSPSEVRALHAQPSERQRERFFSYWTLKESYIKARGLGLAIPLQHFAFALDDGPEIRVGFEPELDDDPTRWQFALLRASSRHFVAVGVDCGEPLRLRASSCVPLAEREGTP